ncbi:hypothetical protein MMC11_005636 [Xylographa trunciseda]|nr:hypothetical protein [Xylographa trunciseda]
MPLISSPIAYPASSSPQEHYEPRKRPQPSDFHTTTAKRKLFGQSLSSESLKSHKVLGKTACSEELPTTASPAKNIFKAPPGPFVEDDTDGDREDQEVTIESVQGSAKVLPVGDTTAISGCGYAVKSGARKATSFKSTSGKTFLLRNKVTRPALSYEQLIASRSATAPGKAQRCYYGMEMHKLMDEAGEIAAAKKLVTVGPPLELCEPSIEVEPSNKKRRSMMWTEKYRAKKFTDLVGDERTHRTVLRWLKGWDSIVFPGTKQPKVKRKVEDNDSEERPHRKILLLTGPPGLGKTTLAHVCARQAGYEIVEINASDERSSQVVKGRIKDSVGTENVRGVNTKTLDGTVRKSGRPVCVVIDEVDGVVSGSGGGGEGGFIKALIDLVILDQKNTPIATAGAPTFRKNKKGERFRLLRPMVLICNDVYHPALRPLRASNLAEIVHIRKPPLDKIVARMKTVFDKEGVASDGDGIRRLCEATWGITNKRESRSNSSHTGEGDMRGILVVGEWVAGKIRGTTSGSTPKLTRQWVERNMLDDLSHGGGGARCIGRGGAKEVLDRVFIDGAGFPKTIAATPVVSSTEPRHPLGAPDAHKGLAIARLRDIIETSGEPDRIMTDVFGKYPSQPFQDDTFLSKPNAAYEWLHFHDTLSSKVFAGQEWELTPYLSQSILRFHSLFASSGNHSSEQKSWGAEEDEEPSPFSGPRADYSAFEAGKQNRAILQGLQSSFSAPLLRSFRSPEDVATDLLPHLIRILTPDVKPVVVGGSGETRGTASVRKESEKEMVRHAVEAMGAVGVSFERARIEDARGGYGGFVYRMEPPLDTLAVFETSSQKSAAMAPTRYAVRQVLDQEFQKYRVRQNADARQARYRSGGPLDPDVEFSAPRAPHSAGKENASKDVAGLGVGQKFKAAGVKRDFFGRVIVNEARVATKAEAREKTRRETVEGNRIWVTYREGFSNAVRKPVSLGDIMRGL